MSKPYHFVTATLIAALISAFPTAASDAGCAWNRTELELPHGTTSSSVVAAAENGWFAGKAAGEYESLDAIRWHGNNPENLGLAFGRATSIVDVNSSGVVTGWAGRMDHRKAVVHRNGHYEYLPAPGDTSYPVAINNAGDIVGMLEPAGRVVVWPAARPGTFQLIDIPGARAIDIDEDGRVLLDSGHDALVWSPNGSVVTIASVVPQKLRNGRVIGTSKGIWTEWNLATGKVTDYGIQAYPLLIDAGTTTAGVFGDDTLKLGVWHDGELQQVLATSTRFNDLSTVGLTDDGVLAVTQYTDTSMRATAFHRTC